MSTVRTGLVLGKLGLTLTAVLVLTAQPVASFSIGCMSEAIDSDPLFDDYWHGGEDDLPTYCGSISEGECEFIETGINAGLYSNYHDNWQTGRLAEHNHGENLGGECEGEIGGGGQN